MDRSIKRLSRLRERPREARVRENRNGAFQDDAKGEPRLPSPYPLPQAEEGDRAEASRKRERGKMKRPSSLTQAAAGIERVTGSRRGTYTPSNPLPASLRSARLHRQRVRPGGSCRDTTRAARQGRSRRNRASRRRCRRV